jgi:hypothetical protein
MNIIEKGHRVTFTSYSHNWHVDNNTGGGYGIPCNWMGVIIDECVGDSGRSHEELMSMTVEEHLSYTRTLYNQLMTGEIDGHKVIYDGLSKYEHSYWEPTVGECGCGNQVVLDSVMYNTCSRCGRDYNSFGQLLGPRSQWGEETGETFFDIDMANYNLNDREGINSLWDDD